MEIVDAHMHFWTPETHPWVAKVKDGGHPAGAFGECGPVVTLNLVRSKSISFVVIDRD